MAIGDTVTRKVLRSIVGVGNKDDIITFTETATTQNQQSAGYTVDYAGPAVPSSTVTHTGGALTLDGSVSSSFIVNLQGNVTALTFTNFAPGARIHVRFVQDATGGRTVAKGTGVRPAGGAFAITAAANAVDVYSFILLASLINETARALNLS